MLGDNLTADELLSSAPCEPCSCFAWLHARWLLAVYRCMQGEIALEDVKSLDKLWEKICRVWKVGYFGGGGRLDICDELRCAHATPACTVCDIIGTSLVFTLRLDLRRFYEALSFANWNDHGVALLRTKNGFHRDTRSSLGGFRDLKVWLALQTSLGPLVAKVQLHLEEFYQEKQRMVLFFECAHGSFDCDVKLREHWWHLLQVLERLLDAVKKEDFDRLSEAIADAHGIGYPVMHLCKAKRLLLRLRAEKNQCLQELEVNREHSMRIAARGMLAGSPYMCGAPTVSALADKRIAKLQGALEHGCQQEPRLTALGQPGQLG